MTFETRPYDLISPPMPAGNAGAESHFSLRETVATMRDWWSGIGERRHQRRVLRSLDDRRLADLGLTREDVSRETAKWPWQL